MKRNHFYMSYCGNKRSEVKYIYDLLDLSNITHIIESYCGSCSISYYISTLHPGKFKYVFNDNDDSLKTMFDIITDKKRAEDFNLKINEMLSSINDKNDYMKITKEDNIYGWFIKNKFYQIRPGLFNMKLDYKNKKIDILKYPISDFFNNEKENITFICGDGLECYLKYKDNENNILILDPPYIMANNNSYKHPSLSIFEYLFKNSINNEKAYIYLIIESTFLMDKLFEGLKKFTYYKGYSNNGGIAGRKTTHMILYNK